MIPVLTPAQMAEVDRNAPESLEVLVDRAATKVAIAAIDMLGGAYGRRVVVVAGPGNNGADGRVAAQKLARRGARVRVLDALEVDSTTNLDRVDLVIDAAFGTGFRGEFSFPDVGDTPVLAVDIPSGVSGLTGRASGTPARAISTVTFAALKPGLLLGEGADLSGDVRLVDIGLDVSGARMHLVEDSDIESWIPQRPRHAHKWRSAVWVFAGSPGMAGAAWLTCAAALRAGAGYVRHSSIEALDTHGNSSYPTTGVETVFHPVEASQWAAALSQEAHRFAVVALGPGVGRHPETIAAVREIASLDGFPLVIDGDGLSALGELAAPVLTERNAPTVLTPHEAEFARLAGPAGDGPSEDRIDATVALAAQTNSVVLLKGPTTIVASPDGSVLLANSGDARLATAGTGDVLTGIIAAHLARGARADVAAAAGAFVHGRAAGLGPATGLIARDVIDRLPLAYTEILGDRP